MAGDRIKVDYVQLGELQQRLQTASDNMHDDSHTMNALASAVGDSRLADRIRDFSDSWDKHRVDIRDRLQWLHDSIKNISEQLVQVDTDLANGLTTPPSGSGGGGRAPQAV
jgi:hypothetical protein